MSSQELIERARQMLNAASQRSTEQKPTNENNAKKLKARLANRVPKGNLQPIWMATEARVISCEREVVTLNRSRLRTTGDAIKFTVSFTYYAHARTHYDSFTSTEAKAKGDGFSVFYNALDPKQNAKSVSDFENRSARSAIGVTGYILISVMFLMIARG